MRFEFATAQRILFGPGVAAELTSAVGRARALLVTGSRPDAVWPCVKKLDIVAVSVTGEPTVGRVRDLAELGRQERCDAVIGIGGGSVIDAAKATAALIANGGDPLDYLEVIGRGMPLRVPPVPFFAVPTTAGAGAEVTRNAVLGSPEHRVKASLRSPLLLPRLALVDPELTYTLPPALTAATGLDALTQLIEPFVSGRANPLTDGLCREGISRAAKALPRAWEGDRAAREEMSLASLLGGLALANAGLGAVHGFAAVIGGMFPAPHGAVCAALLPHVMEANLGHGGPAQERYIEIARLVTGRENARAGDGIDWVAQLCSRLAIPRLSAYGMGAADAAAVVENAAKASSMKANPVALSTSELTEILLRAI